MKKITRVKNDLGMHARPAGVIAELAMEAKNEIHLCVHSDRVDATNIIDILTLGAVKGTKVVIEIENQDDVTVLNDIIEFFEAGFGEI